MNTTGEPEMVGVDRQSTWWRREGGGREVTRLALPLVLSTASWALMHFVDRLLLFWHSPLEMAAALPSGNLVWTMMALPLGIASYVNTFVAQYHGAEQPTRIGPVVRQGLLFGWLVTPLFCLAIPVAPAFFRVIGHQGELADQEAVYFQINCVGAGAAVLASAYSSFYTGRGQMAMVMWIDIGASLLNGLLDWVWIFGHWSQPELGIAGAALGTVVSQWAKVAIYWWLLADRKQQEFYGLAGPAWRDLQLARRLARFGCPNGLQFLLEGSAFTVFLLSIGRFGTIPTAATTLAISVNMVAFVPMFGLGIAVSTLVGNYLGANRPELAARATWTGLTLALAYNALFALAYLGTPELFLILHRDGAEAAEGQAIRELAITLLQFVGGYCLFDATQLVFCSAIKGAGDTRFVVATTIVTSLGSVCIGQAGAWLFAGETLWWWTVLLLWIVTLSLAYGLRFRQGKWRTMRVIEADSGEVLRQERIDFAQQVADGSAAS